jgi:hypothetical protein
VASDAEVQAVMLEAVAEYAPAPPAVDGRASSRLDG